MMNGRHNTVERFTWVTIIKFNMQCQPIRETDRQRERQRERESNLVFYAQSTITVISGRKETETETGRDRQILFA